MKIIRSIYLTTTCITLLTLMIPGCQGIRQPIAGTGFPLKETWHFQADSELTTQPAVGDGKVVIRTGRKVYALDARTGVLLWNVPLASDLISYPTPALVRDDLVVIGYRTGVRALSAASGNTVWERQNTDCEGTYVVPAAFSEAWVYVVRNHCDVKAYDVATGNVVWDINVPGGRRSADLFIDRERIYLVITGDLFQIRESATGKLIEETTGQIGWPVGYQRGVLYGRRGEDQLVAYDIQTKRTLWVNKGISMTDPPALTEQQVLVSISHGQPAAFDIQTGKLLWVAPIDRGIYPTPIVMGDKVYILALGEGRVYALSIHDGTILGYLSTVSQPVTTGERSAWQPVVTESLLIIPLGKTVYAYGD